MPDSAVLDRRQHVGLQKLSALAGISRSSLGPEKKFKFVRDEASGESALAGSCFRVVESLELTCAVGQLVRETVRAHHEVYRTGSGCLLFLAGAWSRAALDCLRGGMSVASVISAMSEGMDACVDVCGRCAVSTEGPGASERPVAGRGTAEVDRETLNVKERRKVKLSRHFCNSESEDVSEAARRSTLPDVIARAARGLSHGRDDAMKLVVEAVRTQSQTNRRDVGSFTFDIAEVVTRVLPGLPEDRACVVPGFVVLLSDERASVARRLEGQRLKVALISGDLSETYRHLGFSRPAGLRRVRDRPGLSGGEDEWTEKVARLLLRLQVKLLLVGGLACERATRRCCGHRILVVEKVPAPVLRAFADSTGAVPVSYASQLTERCVGAGATLSIRRDLGGHGRESVVAAASVSAGDGGRLVTAILTSCVRGKLQTLEDQFWACAHRLHRALKDGVVLPGAGGTEMLCVHRLQRRAENLKDGFRQTETETAADRCRSEVLQLMADGLIDYVSTVMVNTGRFSKVEARTAVSRRLRSPDGHPGVAAGFSQLFSGGEDEDGGVSAAAEIYDNLSVKQEAWRKALDLVFLVLQTDAEIITGVDPKTASEQDNLTLL
ncbi:Bardet-Biedl syndrome 12 protein [Embiotoca jacksoni]|uniref:Bardet-Biedl syndrome 12 protein n=1 Tax=Embiotoca jacksoni TaxID=100190 RepID=UPI003704AC8B